MNAELARLLEAYERSLLDSGIRKLETAEQLLAESFVEFGSSGRVYTKAQVVASMRAGSSRRVSASQFNVRLLAPDIALVTYRTCRSAEHPVHALRSSIWAQTEGQWQLVFHQGTLTKES